MQIEHITKVAVSIIVPVYNVSEYIDKCLDTLVNQSLLNIEIILVDDGSTDSSGYICDQYADSYPQIKVIHRKNGGLGLARNSGLEVATGEYIGFVDSDDFVSTKMFEYLYKNAIENSADISYGAWERFVDEREVGENTQKRNKIELINGKENIRQYLLDRIGLSPESAKDNLYGASVWAGIFRRNIIEENKLRFVSEREFIAEDIIFDIDIIPLCDRIVHCDIPLYYYRYNPNSLTTVYKPDRYEQNVKLYHEMYRRMLKTFSRKECFNSMSRYLLTVSRIAIIQESAFLRKNGIKHAWKKIRTICNNEELQAVLSEYPYDRLQFRYKYLCLLEKWKASGLILILVYIFYIKKR